MDKPIALVVEDDPDIACIFERALQTAGFEVQVTRTGTQALSVLRTLVPNLIVLDVSLPGMSGIDLLECVRSDPRLSEARVITATAHSHIGQRTRDQSDLVLLKPISFAQLRDLSKRLVAPTA